MPVTIVNSKETGETYFDPSAPKLKYLHKYSKYIFSILASILFESGEIVAEKAISGIIE